MVDEYGAGGRARRDRVVSAELESFELALKHAHDDPWWRQFMDLVRERRQAFTEALVSGEMDQRAEDRTRGQISELTFILSLDMYGGRDDGRKPERD